MYFSSIEIVIKEYHYNVPQDYKIFDFHLIGLPLQMENFDGYFTWFLFLDFHLFGLSCFTSYILSPDSFFMDFTKIKMGFQSLMFFKRYSLNAELRHILILFVSVQSVKFCDLIHFSNLLLLHIVFSSQYYYKEKG